MRERPAEIVDKEVWYGKYGYLNTTKDHKHKSQKPKPKPPEDKSDPTS